MYAQGSRMEDCAHYFILLNKQWIHNHIVSILSRFNIIENYIAKRMKCMTCLLNERNLILIILVRYTQCDFSNHNYDQYTINSLGLKKRALWDIKGNVLKVWHNSIKVYKLFMNR